MRQSLNKKLFYEVPNSESFIGAILGVLLGMKCYRFNKDRSFQARFGRPIYSRKKLIYMVGTGRSRLLDSCYHESQTWGAIHKAWKGYIIAKNKDEFDRLYFYAEIIQKLQRELGLPVSSFPSLGLSPQKIPHDMYEDYEPSEEHDRAMRREQNYNPSEEHDRAMESERD